MVKDRMECRAARTFIALFLSCHYKRLRHRSGCREAIDLLRVLNSALMQ
jgi:hypothetical protein